MHFYTPPKFLNSTVRVIVIGVGGTGSVVVSLLAQMNYLLRAISDGQSGLTVHAYDGDTVSRFNLGRQNFYPQDLKKPKSEVIINRINQGFGTEWVAHDCDYTPHGYIHGDVLITCVDSVKVRLKMGETYHNTTTEALWIDAGNDRQSGQVIMGHLGSPESGNKLPNWWDLYGQAMQSVKDDPTDSCSHADALRKQDFGVNHQSALLAVQPLWQLLRHGKVALSGQYFDVKEGTVTPLRIDPDVWATFGFT